MPTDFDHDAPTYDQNPMRHERAETVAASIRSQLSLKSTDTGLEYGCGTGLLSFELLSYLGHVTLVDNSTGMLTVVGQKIADQKIKNAATLQADFLADPLPELRVDLVYSLMVLHHIPDTDRILRAFYGVLKTPGTLCVADLDAEDGSFHGQDDLSVHKGFDRDELAERVRRAGFHDVKFSTVYHVPRQVGDQVRSFPLFLMIAKK
jgi:ubiquinone/menaquinone biosynthesis C-methylase UbiE